MSKAIDYSRLLHILTARFALDKFSVHGPSHWKRVEEIGLRIGEKSGADPAIVRLFSLFHDSCRMNDGHDPLHGQRGAVLARALHGIQFDLDAKRLEILEYACIWHADGRLSTDATIGTCWDADRLDLPRVGIMPSCKYLSTEAAKDKKLVSWALSIPRRN